MPVTRSTKTSQAHEKPARKRSKQPVANNHQVWVAKKLGGDFPPLTVHSKTVSDPRRGKVYVYGGYMPDDDAEMPLPYLHVFDTKTMKFTDLTNSLTYVTPGDPYSDAMLNREVKPLPSLSQPGIVLLELNNHPRIFIFGGYDAGDADGPSSTLIAVNTTHKEWYHVEFEDSQLPPPAPRIDPILVGVDEKLYIFGGIKNFGDNWTYHRTFSIIDFQLNAPSRKCKWLIVDAPYPDNVPANQLFGKGLPINNGTAILLLPGREKATSKLHIQKDNIFYFITMNETFMPANPKGVLPRDTHWYYACNFNPSLTLSSEPLSSEYSPATPSILLCTWIPHGQEDLSPEFWHFSAYPKNTFTRLGISDRVYDLEKNFQRFALVGNRAFLMGQGDGSDDNDGEEGAMCDTYVEIPVQELL
ncbi:hypothetical protein CPB84DRAFT_1765288 [Gymnopilus junonius]|uniref:Uncharacterized protein n=1 Tax=Gymnopilus junonius TaxID=109634 RepID=A0A9P5TSW3_GYMJU|nr:hypothetical protein CPB84DRAFT_1765288 [Gymnopilus junonius]